MFSFFIYYSHLLIDIQSSIYKLLSLLKTKCTNYFINCATSVNFYIHIQKYHDTHSYRCMTHVSPPKWFGRTCHSTALMLGWEEAFEAGVGGSNEKAHQWMQSPPPLLLPVIWRLNYDFLCIRKWITKANYQNKF